MPFFNEASRIYTLEEVNFMRRIYSDAATKLEERELDYAAIDLSSTIIMLYESGLRDLGYITELAVRLAHQKFQFRHPYDNFPAANSNMEAANED
ncbi:MULTISPECIES: hypothetical protein [Brucella/Ochrobactrum group]|uniref:hypothetical protein n=1 Tax=Brucella/Ochrobactrum group TaxID=2826938 RepID=UPI000D706E43|nr:MULTISPECIES: hypothetical protein [Brucella/Ochrobactrum group]PWU70681.1 hypothetical protein DK867_23515 [Ochrobactrum sp. POC9]